VHFVVVDGLTPVAVFLVVDRQDDLVCAGKEEKGAGVRQQTTVLVCRFAAGSVYSPTQSKKKNAITIKSATALAFDEAAG
jgi:hypothetical protein